MENMRDIIKELMDGVATVESDPCMVPGCEEPKDGPRFCTAHRDKAKAIWEAGKERAAEDYIAEHIGRKYVNCTWDNIEMKESVVNGIRSTISSGGSVILSGKPGVGKTHVLTCIFRDIHKSGSSCEFWTCPALFDKLRLLAMDSDNSLSKFVDHFRDVEWLFIDDLGVGKVSEFVLEQLFRIIDWRSRDGAPVVITSNLTAPQIADVYDSRLSSRLVGLAADGGYGKEITGEDGRTKSVMNRRKS
jgi:DNA replication protein DnaC